MLTFRATIASIRIYFTVEQRYNKLVNVSGGYGERVTEARQMLPNAGARD